MSARPQREPRFLWTGLMILLPVLALGALGLWQLKTDHAAAIAKARADAEQPLAEVLRVAKRPIDPSGPGTVEMKLSSDGQTVLWPKPIPVVPVPLTDGEVSPHASSLAAILDDQTISSEDKAMALATLMEDNRRDRSFGAASTVAGLPVKQLALRNALKFGSEAGIGPLRLQDWANQLATEAIVNRPTIFTGRLIEEARAHIIDPETSRLWNSSLERWERQQESRRFFRENKAEVDRLVAPLLVLEPEDEPVRFAGWIESDRWFYWQLSRSEKELDIAAHPKDVLTDWADSIINFRPLKLPDHLGIRLTLDGRTILGDASSEAIAMGEDRDQKLRAEVVLTDREAFFAPIRQRTSDTAAVISLAMLAAGIGWFAAWRAFVRQQQLAAMKDNFVSAVSHELKAPIASIGLMAEELGSGSTKREEYAKLIAGECGRLGSLVDNVLDYARIESGSDEFVFEEADLGELVRSAAELMRPPAKERGIEVEVDAPPAGELCANIDARAIARALVNLLDNATKYAPANRPITLSATDKQITVSDLGDPIPAAEREQIFERFFRSGSELTRETKGVGIGLSLVRHIANAHGGRAWVDSDEQGNHFRISFRREA